MLKAMASQVFPLAVIPSLPASGIHLTLDPVLAIPPGQWRALTAAIAAPATLAMAAGRLAADLREQPLERSPR